MKIYFYNVPDEMSSITFPVQSKMSGTTHHFFEPASAAKKIKSTLNTLSKNNVLVTDREGIILVHMKLTDNVSDALKELAIKFGFVTKQEEHNWSKDELKEIFVFDSEDDRAPVYGALTPNGSLTIAKKKEINMILNGYLNYLTDQPNGIDGGIVLDKDGDIYATSTVAAGNVLQQTAALNLDKYPTAVRHFQHFIQDAKEFGRGQHEDTTLIFSSGIVKIVPYQSKRLNQELLIILINSVGRRMSGTFSVETKSPLLEIGKCIEDSNYRPSDFAALPQEEQDRLMNP